MFESPTRNHFTIIFERLGAVIAFFLVYAFNVLKDYGWEIFTLSFYADLLRTVSEEGTKSVIGVLLFFVIIAVSLFVAYRYWRKTCFYIEGTDFIFKRNTMFKMDSRLPIMNIAVVNVERNIFERVVGTAKVKIDLNSSRTASKTDFKFVLKRDDALKLKEKLLFIKSSQQSIVSDAADGASEVVGDEMTPPTATNEAEPRERVAFFTLAQALRHKLLSFPIFQSAFTLTLVFVLPLLSIDGDSGMSRTWYLLAIAVVGCIWSFISGTLNFGEYTVERDRRMIYISCGVINKRNYAFETEKINAVVINEPALARLFGMCSISLAVVGLGNEKNETTHLSLTMKRREAEEIIKKCVPDFWCSEEPVKTHPIIIVYPIIRAIVVGAAAMLLGVAYNYAVVLAAVTASLLLIGALLEYSNHYFCADENVVFYSRGMFSKSSGMIKYGDIQDIRIKTNVFLRKLGIGRMRFTILSASSMQSHKTGWFKLELLDGVAGRVVATEENVSRGLQ